MPEGPRQSESLSLPPPGFAADGPALKRVQLIDLLEKIIEKCQREPQFVDQQPQQTDLLVSIAQFALLSPPVSPGDKRDFLNSIVTIGQNLLTDESHAVHVGISSPVDSNSSSSGSQDATIPILPPAASNNDDDFSLDDLANEYLQNDPSPPSSAEKLSEPRESSEPDPTLDHASKASLPPASEINVLDKLAFTPLPSEILASKPQLDSILFSDLLTLHDDDECMWKDQSSAFGQIFCTKVIEPEVQVQKRVSDCLLDRSLYERLTRLIALLPKECVRQNLQPMVSMRPNEQSHRPGRPNNDNRRPAHQSSFQQNSMQMYQNQRYPPGQNVRHHGNANYSNQQGNNGGHFVDRRQQQQNRYAAPPPPSYVPYGNEQQYPRQHQQRGPAPKYNPHTGGQPQQPQQQQQQQQQKKRNPPNNQQASNQPPQPRGGNRGPGGNKSNNEKPGASGSNQNRNKGPPEQN